VQVTVERPAPCVAKISFSVPYDEFAAELHKQLTQAGRNLRVKGFRPGHVPPQVVEKIYGKEVREETKRGFVQRAFERAISENKLKPLAHPNVTLPEEEVSEGGEYGFDFEVNLRPDFELGAYAGLEVESELKPVSDEEVEAAIEQVAKNNARPEPAGDQGLPDDGMALAKVEFLYGDQTVFMRDGLRISPASPIVGVEPEESKRALSGAKDGAVIELPAVFPQDVEVVEARGQSGTCRITIGQAFRVVPPSREELIKMLDVKDEQELAAKVREKLEEANRDMENRRIENTVIERLIDEHEMELPASMIEEQVSGRLAALRRELAQQNVPEAEIESQVQAQEQNARTQAERAARGYFLIEKIAEKEGLKVSDEDMSKELRAIAERNRTSFEDVRNYYREKNLTSQLAMEIVERKVREFLRDKTVVTSESEKA
jgi:trigger factor